MSLRTKTKNDDESQDTKRLVTNDNDSSTDMNFKKADRRSLGTELYSYKMDAQEKGDDFGDKGDSGKQFSYRRIILSTHFNIFMYSTCFWIQNGTLPYLTKKLGADPVTFGYLQTTFAVVQLAGGPLFGRFGDIFGGRAAMTLAFVAAASSYTLLGLSYNLSILFTSRLPSVFMHAMQGGQMIVTDIGDSNKRADALGKLGMSYGVGMVIGPFVGGIITKTFGEQSSAFVAALGSVLSIFFVLQFVPRQTKQAAMGRSSSGSSYQSQNIFSVKKLLALISAPNALFLLCVRFFAGIPIGVFQSMFQVVALEKFQLPPDQNGYLMSYIGVTTMIVQGIGVGYVTKQFPESLILIASSFILIFSYLLLAYVGTVWQLCVVCLPLVMGLTTQNVVVTSALTHTVGEEDTGAMLGLNMAVNSLVRTFSPTVGGYLLENFGFASFGIFGLIVSMVLTLVLFARYLQRAL